MVPLFNYKIIIGVKMASRLFDCAACAAYGKITLKSNDHNIADICCCPICGADISLVDEEDEEIAE